MSDESKKQRIEELLKKIRSVPWNAENNDTVHNAIDELIWRRWLEDGSLSGVDLRVANLKQTDLKAANLSKSDLRQANLRQADLRQANLRQADLRQADLSQANLGEADLWATNFCEAELVNTGLWRSHLWEAKLIDADLEGADLWQADMRGVNLIGAYLVESSLKEADLRGADLTSVIVEQADLSEIRISTTNFTNVDLSNVIGLETIRHRGSSTLSHETLFNYGRLPDVFLRGCGLPEIFITYYGALRGEAIMFYDTFISYSHKDKAFANRLYEHLQAQGVRCWLDEHDLPYGKPVDEGIMEGIKYSAMTIFLCSEHSLDSNWVNKELTATFRKEDQLREEKPNAYNLIPIDLDGAIFDNPDELRVTSGKISTLLNRNMMRMQDWDDISTDAFNQRVEKLIDALRKDAPDD